MSALRDFLGAMAFLGLMIIGLGAADAIGSGEYEAQGRVCVALAVWGESRGEPHAGQQMVAQVVLNRSRASGESRPHPAMPASTQRTISQRFIVVRVIDSFAFSIRNGMLPTGAFSGVCPLNAARQPEDPGEGVER